MHVKSIKLQGIQVNMLHIGMKKKIQNQNFIVLAKLITALQYSEVLHSSKHEGKNPKQFPQLHGKQNYPGKKKKNKAP